MKTAIPNLDMVIPNLVAERASELAVINGRPADDVSELDLEQARRELTGEPDTDPKDAIPEGSPEAERWSSDPGSIGRPEIQP